MIRFGLLFLFLLCSCQRIEVKTEVNDPLSGLHASLDEVNRIVVSHVDSQKHYVLRKPDLDSLMEEVKVSGLRNYFQCICYSDVVFYAYHNEKLLEVFAYFEEGAFAWHEAAWSGDAELTLQSHDALSLWYHEVLPRLTPLPEGAFDPPPID